MNKEKLYDFILNDTRDLKMSSNKRYTKEDLINDLFVNMCEKNPCSDEFEEVYLKVKNNLLNSKGRDKIGPFSLTKDFKLNPPEKEDCDNIVISLLKRKLNDETLTFLKVK